MSVTVTIENNKLHSQPKIEEVDCFCNMDLNCPFCDGTTIQRVKVYPFELNLHNDNFVTLWRALRINIQDYSGSLYPAPFLKRLEETDLDSIELGHKERYMELLILIAKAAEKMEEKIVWS